MSRNLFERVFEAIVIFLKTFENVVAGDLGHLRAAAVVLSLSLGSEADNIFLFLFSTADRHQTRKVDPNFFALRPVVAQVVVIGEKNTRVFLGTRIDVLINLCLLYTSDAADE